MAAPDIDDLAARARALSPRLLAEVGDHPLRQNLEDGLAENPRTTLQVYADFVSTFHPTAPDQQVVDVGCGYGLSLVALGLLLPCRVVGVEIDPERIEAGRRVLSGLDPDLAHRVSLVEGDVVALPFADASVDFLISNEGANVYLDLDAFLREASRVLKPGGGLVVAGKNTQLHPVLRRRGVELREAYENGPAPQWLYGHQIDRPYVARRAEIVRRELPDLEASQVEMLARGTSGMTAAQVERACAEFRADGTVPDRVYVRGDVPVAPEGMVVERPIDPYELAGRLRRLGFETEVRGYWGGGGGRRWVRAVNGLLVRGQRLTIRASPGYRVLAVRGR